LSARMSACRGGHSQAIWNVPDAGEQEVEMCTGVMAAATRERRNQRILHPVRVTGHIGDFRLDSASCNDSPLTRSIQHSVCLWFPAFCET